MGTNFSRRDRRTGAEQRARCHRRRRSEMRRAHRRRSGRARVLPLGNQICAVLANVFEITPAQLRAPTRGPARVALARQIAIYLAHTGCGLTLEEAGRLFRRDRTTAAHGCGVVEDLRDDPGFDRALTMLETVVLVGCGLSESL